MTFVTGQPCPVPKCQRLHGVVVPSRSAAQHRVSPRGVPVEQPTPATRRTIRARASLSDSAGSPPGPMAPASPALATRQAGTGVRSPGRSAVT